MQYIPIITLVLVVILLGLVIVLLTRKPEKPELPQQIDPTASITALGTLVTQNLREGREAQSNQLSAMDKSLGDKMSGLTDQLGRFETRLQGFTAETTQNLTNIRETVDKNLHTFTGETKQDLENIRVTVDKNLRAMQEDNNKKLDDMRQIVDEKLQKTLSERMNESFKLVNERLEQVYKGLGEMQTLAQGVGDLKKVLTNVKTRGIVGEIQLGAILEDILAPEQYETNVATVPNSRNVVEYAVKLPVEDGSFVWLPIDSKFPGDTYGALRDAYEEGSREQIDACVKQLIATLKSEAKDIHDKYLAPPHTTEFGIMFLPFEGLYAEAVSRGMVEILQRDYHVNLAGPSTMAALLNSLQMSFRTIAIQKRSGEVWSVLGAVKTEFDKFEACLTQTQNRLDQASRELDKLVGTRTRAIRRKLKGVTELSESRNAEGSGYRHRFGRRVKRFLTAFSAKENTAEQGLIVTSNYFVAENGVTRRSRRFSAFIGCLCDNRLGNNGNIHIVHKVEKNLHFLLALAAGLVRGIDNDLLDILVHDGLCQFLHIHIFLCQGDKGIQTVIHFFPLFHPFFDNFNFEL